MQTSITKLSVLSSVQVKTQNPIVQGVAKSQRNTLLISQDGIDSSNGLDPNTAYNYPIGTPCFDLLQNFTFLNTLTNIDRFRDGFSYESFTPFTPATHPFPDGRCTLSINVTTDPGVGIMVFSTIDKLGKDQSKWFEDLYTGAHEGNISIELFTDLHTVQITKEGQSWTTSTVKQLTVTGKLKKTIGYVGVQFTPSYKKSTIYHIFIDETDIFNAKVSKDVVIAEVRKLSFKSICLPGYIIDD